MAKTVGNKRVLIVTQHYWPENFRINDITAYLGERGVEVDVLCGRPNYPKGHFFPGYTFFNRSTERHENVNIFRSWEIPRRGNSGIMIFLNYISFPLFSLFITPRLLFCQYDAVLIYQTSPVMMGLAGLIVGKVKRVPITTYVLDLWPENLFSVFPIKSPFWKRIATAHSHWYYRHSTKLVALSQSMRTQLANATGRSESSIPIIVQSCEKLYEQPLKDIALEERFKDLFCVLFTGNISPAQSPATMVTAAKILADRGYSDIHWIIVGDGMSRTEMEHGVNEMGLSEAFSFEGQHPIDDIPKYTNIADVLVGCLVKSDLLEATIPAKVMSYIASGRPIVLAMDGEVQDLINQTIHCGFAGPTEDAEVLAENILKVYNSPPAVRAEMGNRATEYHSSHFEREIVLHKLYNFIFGENSVE